MSRMFARLSKSVEIFAIARSVDGVVTNFATTAMSNIHNVVEYPSTIPDPGVGSILPVCAKVRAKPRVIAESSHVRVLKRHATTI
jgi:hypothetical protein